MQKPAGLNPEIEEYIEGKIIPQYGNFDKAHNINHIRRVIQVSLEMARDYSVDFNLIYVIAAYHDIGMPKGRKDHGRHSAEFLLNDNKLRDWFSDEEIKLMAEAIEDHRASIAYEPRSIYGKIVSDADNDLRYSSVLKRCLQHGLAYFPQYDKETHFLRIREHMEEKYGEGGYLKTWLNTEHDKRGLREIRNKLYKNQQSLRDDFDRLWDSEH